MKQRLSLEERVRQLESELEKARGRESALAAELDQTLESRRALEDFSRKQASLFQLSPVPALIVDPRGVIVEANTAAKSLWENDVRSLTGALLRGRVALAEQQAFSAFLARGRRTAEVVRHEVHFTINQKDVLFELHSRPLANERGSRMITLVDISERAEVGQERERLRQLAEDAREAAAAKDQFIAMLSHELRTPLTPVLATISALLQRPNLPPDMRRMLTMAAKNVDAERRLIDDLLDTTRIANQKLAIDRKTVDVHQIVEEAVDTLAYEIDHKRLTITVDLAAEEHWVSGDPGRLRQVFWNLLQNAVKFTALAGHIDIRSWNRGGRVAIEVADDGIGLAPETLSGLFIPFHQVPGGRTGSRGGLGLGLAICRGLVALHGGDIAVSSPGLERGARFVVDLRTVAAVASVQPTRLAETGPAGFPAFQPRQSDFKPRILLVEDDVDTADTLAELLRLEGYEIRVANSVNAALGEDVEAVDFILSDIGLGDGSGLDLMRALRARKELPGIVLSGYGTENDIHASRQAGFSAHLTKPVTVDVLVTAIQRVTRPVHEA